MKGRGRLALTLIFLLALALRLLALHHYRFIGADGGVDGVAMAISGKNLFSGAGFSFQGKPETIHAPLFPILIGAAWKLLGNLELAGQAVSVIAGALLVLPVFLLARDLYGRWTGLIAAAFAAVFPPFVYASTEVRLASLYALLCCFAAWLMRRGGLRPGFLAGAGTGAVVALCYLARPEAVLFLPLAAVLSFLRGRKRKSPGPRPAAPSTNPSAASEARGSDIPVAIQADPDRGRNAPHPAAVGERSRSGAARISYLAGIALGFALLSSPYWVFLKRQLGRWTLNGRGPFTFVGYFHEDWDRAYFDLYTYPDQARRMWAEAGGMPGFLQANLGASLRRLAENLFSLATNLGHSSQVAKLGLPPVAVNAAVAALGALALGGVGLQILRRRWIFRDTFLALFSATVLPYLLLTWQDLRYFYPYFPIPLILLAEGCRRWADRVAGSPSPAPPGRRALAAIPAALLILALLGASLVIIPRKIRTVPYEYKILGLWMRDHLPGIERETVMSRKMGVPFYAGSSHALIHPGSYVEVVGFAREAGARYLVADDWTTPAFRPALSFLLDETAPTPPDLERVHFLRHAGRRIVLYRFKTVSGGIPGNGFEK